MSISRRDFIAAASASGLAGVALPSGLRAWSPEKPGVFEVNAFGAKGDGTTDDTAAIQATIDAADKAGGGVVLLEPGGKYLITQEVQLRADNATFVASEAQIIGPDSGTRAGDLICVVDRRAPSRRIVGVSLRGGLWHPRAGTDNAIGVVSTNDCSISGCAIDLSTGQRGIVIESRFSVSGQQVSNVSVSAVHAYGGGRHGIFVLAQGLDGGVEQIRLRDIRIDDAEVGLWVGSDSDKRSVSGVTCSGISVNGSSKGALILQRVRNGMFTDLQIQAGRGPGLQARQLASVMIRCVVLEYTGPAQGGEPIPSQGITLVAGTGQNGSTLLADLTIRGPWGSALSLRQDNTIVDGTIIDGATVGVDGGPQHTIFGRLLVRNCALPVRQTESPGEIWDTRPLVELAGQLQYINVRSSSGLPNAPRL